MKTPSVYFGIDIGGTNIKTGLITSEGTILDEGVIPTLVPEGPAAAMDRIADYFLKLVQKNPSYSIDAVGIGIPGILDPKSGILIFISNLPGWENLHLKRELEQRIQVPVFIENDGNVAALGEKWLGAGQGQTDFLMITLGTGIGGGLILYDKLHDLNGVSCEFGHMIIDVSGVKCACGRTGCLETYFSGKGLTRLLVAEIARGTPTRIQTETVEKMSPLELARAAQNQDQAALRTFQQAGEALGVAMGNMINLLGIHFYVIGGGVANSWDLFYDDMYRAAKNVAFDVSRDQIQIVRAQLGEKAGFIGAAALGKYWFERNQACFFSIGYPKSVVLGANV